MLHMVVQSNIEYSLRCLLNGIYYFIWHNALYWAFFCKSVGPYFKAIYTVKSWKCKYMKNENSK